jgi:hypothetical protein
MEVQGDSVFGDGAGNKMTRDQVGSDTTDNTAAAVVLISPMAFTRYRPDKPGMTHNPQVDRRRPGSDWHSQCRLCMLPFMQVDQDASMRWRVII